MARRKGVDMREIKFRAWHNGVKTKTGKWVVVPHMLYDENPGDCLRWRNDGQDISEIMQYTGLKDKSGLLDVYEGDIVSNDGEVVGNVHERENRYPTDFVVEGMGTSKWRDAESEAIRRGCKYAE